LPGASSIRRSGWRLTYLAWFWLIRHYPPSRLASFTFLTPLFGVLAGGLLLNEPITGGLLLALALVGAGIYLVNRPNAAKIEQKGFEDSRGQGFK
jgi:drug/metabolite transporter (DMT)-like permease